MTLPLVFMFGGQGSHYYAMGKNLLEVNTTFHDWMLKADHILIEKTGLSVLEFFYHRSSDKEDTLINLRLSHPAIFMVEYALAQMLLEKGIKPDLIIGSSLGEIMASAVAGAISFESALNIILAQVESLIQCNQPGHMIAILHHHALYKTDGILAQLAELAAINFESHFIVSVSANNKTRLEEHLKKQNVTYFLLPVSQAFHSSLINPAKSFFLKSIQSIHLHSLHIPLVSCAYARVMNEISHEYFWDVISQPIRFPEVLQLIEKKHAAFYLDLTPSGTLANFVKYNLSSQSSNSKQFSLLSPYSQDLQQFNQILTILEK